MRSKRRHTKKAAKGKEQYAQLLSLTAHRKKLLEGKRKETRIGHSNKRYKISTKNNVLKIFFLVSGPIFFSDTPLRVEELLPFFCKRRHTKKGANKRYE